jgi:hypothetical protein
MTVDTGVGSSEAENAQDRNCAHVWRPPNREGENRSWPVMVAACRSSLETINFARNCIYGCMYYNFALLAPESKGETAAAFISEVRDYPFMFTMTVINDKTRKPTDHLGFDMNARTRRAVFAMVGDYLNEFYDEDDPRIPHFYTLKELAEMVVGKRGRPDHPNGGTSDCAVAFAVGLYVWQHAKEQMRDNSGYYDSTEEEENYLDKWGDRIKKTTETRPVLGSKRGLDERSRKRTVR